MATTPTPDRMGDIVEPLGVIFKNPLPLLWQHRSSEPVGRVNFGKPTANGISFKAKVETIDTPGKLKDRLDEAWQSVSLGLVRAVSIGFRSIERAWMDGGGIHFIKSEVFELSLVTIPANAEATITAVKAADAAAIARRRRLEPLPPVVKVSAPAAPQVRPPRPTVCDPHAGELVGAGLWFPRTGG